MRLLLLRHGNTFNTHETPYQIGCKTDLPLTAQGLLQAEAFVSYLKKHQLIPHAIYCGSLQRQLQTANIIHEAFPQVNLVTKQAALNEIDYGAWEGLTLAAIQNQWPQEHQQWQEQGEWPTHIFKTSLQSHLDLLQTWLLDIQKSLSSEKLIIAISSQGILRLWLRLFPQMWQKVITTQSLPFYKVNTGHFCDVVMNNMQSDIQAWNARP